MAASPLDTECFTVVDVETSGLNPRWRRVLQVAIVRCRGDGTVIDRWSTLVNPGRWRGVGPTRIHGITRSMLRSAPRFREIAPEVARRLNGIVVGHNVEFDWAFLTREFRRAGQSAPAPELLCTLSLSRAADPMREQRHRLIDVAERAGLAFTHPHDALADAEVTAAALPHLLAGAGLTSVTDLAAFAQR